MKINLPDRIKGYIFAFIAVIAVSNVYIFSKAALNEATLAQFGTYWFAFGVLWNLIFAIQRKKLRNLSTFGKNQFLLLFVVGLLEILATSFFFLAIHTVPNPAIVSFIGNVNPVFVTILGFVFLRERFNIPELIGMALAVLGAFIISYQGSEAIENIFIEGTGYMILSGFIYSFSTIIAKKNIQTLGPSIMSLSRTLHLFLFSIGALWYLGESIHISSRAFWNIFIGSGLGPFLTALAGYQALKYIEASRASILGSSKGLFVLIGAYFYFDTFPQMHQIWGGLISISGVILISMGKIKFSKQENKKPLIK
ncbi:MAG: DMT family transporter [Bacteroidales bacterium]|jgi:drug/metabolite transporter (DMT)-like permease|nr:DMT family transporter [Bacteroidales bacterium]